jgi:hypothetical protein
MKKYNVLGDLESISKASESREKDNIGYNTIPRRVYETVY